MAAYTIFVVLVLARSALSEEGSFFDPCYKDDIKCLSTATEKFLEKSYQGIPQYDIKAIDPLIIPSLDVNAGESMGVTFRFKNINVTGLKNQKFSDYKMDTTTKSVMLKTKVDLNIVGDVTIELTKQSKTFTGTYTASATALGTSQYNYSLKKNNKDGLEYFDVHTETNGCEIIGEPNVTLGEELQKALYNDADAQSLKPGYEAHKNTLRKNTLCKIVETSYITVIHNLRAAAKILPKTAFFKDI